MSWAKRIPIMLCLARMIKRCPFGGQLAVAYRSDRFLVPGDACRRGTAFGYEPVRLKLRQQKKLRAVTGAVICRQGFRANTRSGHEAAQSQKARGEHEAP